MKLARWQLDNKDALILAIQEEWQAISQDEIMKAVSSMPRRLEQIIERDGPPIPQFFPRRWLQGQ